MTDTPTTEGQGDRLPVNATDKLLADFVEHSKTLTVEDPEEVQERILRSLLTATTAHDILHAGEATPASDVYGVPLQIVDIRASESDYQEGNDLYLHIDAKIIGNGDHVAISCGARDVVVKLIRLHQLGLLPVSCVIERSAKQTAAGYYPVFLRELPPPKGDPSAPLPGEEPF